MNISTIDELFASASTEEGSNVYDLEGQTLEIAEGAKLNFSEGVVTITNGTIACNSGTIAVSGASTTVTFGPNITVDGLKNENTLINIQRRGTVILDHATVISASDAPACSVEGSGIAKDNSTLVVKTESTIAGPVAVEVIKGGLVRIEPDAIISSETAIIAKGNRTRLEICDSSCSGTIEADDDVLILKLGEEAEATSEDDVVAEDAVETSEPVVAAEPEVIEPVVAEELAEVEAHAAEVVEAEEKPAKAPEDIKESVSEVNSDLPKSAVLTKQTFVYGVPSTKSYICRIIGAVKIIGENDKFYQIKFRMPGKAEKLFTGYILKASSMKKM